MKTNEIKEPSPKATNVVYAFKCTYGDCKLRTNACYIGHTTTTLSRCLTMHLQSGAILRHTKDEHDHDLNRQDLVNNTTILAREPDRKRLVILEAVYIRDAVPTMNTQEDIQGICSLYDSSCPINGR